MTTQSLSHTYKRYRTLQTDRITALPIVILMPHSACNCRCVMCDIWKGNKNLKQLGPEDVKGLLSTLKKLNTRQVLMSGGEALLNQKFFELCDILRDEDISITLLSTGLTLKRNAEQLLTHVNDIIVSLDGDEALHDAIRNIPGAYSKLKEGVQYIKAIDPGYKISGRSVIHKLNYMSWQNIVESAMDIGLDSISFLPADVTSTAFNRDTPWDASRQQEVVIPEKELPELKNAIEQLLANCKTELDSHFIVESLEKIWKIYAHYCASYGLNSFPEKKCNAPWVSTVIEADGAVRPCFFHPVIGNIKSESLENILNSESSVTFRKNLDTNTDSTCLKCVCSLNLKPHINPAN